MCGEARKTVLNNKRGLKFSSKVVYTFILIRIEVFKPIKYRQRGKHCEISHYINKGITYILKFESGIN